MSDLTDRERYADPIDEAAALAGRLERHGIEAAHPCDAIAIAIEERTA